MRVVFDAAIILNICVMTIIKVWKQCGDESINQCRLSILALLPKPLTRVDVRKSISRIALKVISNMHSTVAYRLLHTSD